MKNELQDYVNELNKRTQDHSTYDYYADAKQVYQAMEDLKKTVLAKVKAKLDFKTESEAERLAYADREFNEYLDRLAAARNAFLKAEAQKTFNLNRIDALITLISLCKEQMKII